MAFQVINAIALFCFEVCCQNLFFLEFRFFSFTRGKFLVHFSDYFYCIFSGLSSPDIFQSDLLLSPSLCCAQPRHRSSRGSRGSSLFPWVQSPPTPKGCSPWWQARMASGCLSAKDVRCSHLKVAKRDETKLKKT